MAGRIVSIFVAKVKIYKIYLFVFFGRVLWLNGFFSLLQVLRPRNMIFLSLMACVVSSIVLVAIGGKTKYGLYAGTGTVLNLFDIFRMVDITTLCNNDWKSI